LLNRYPYGRLQCSEFRFGGGCRLPGLMERRRPAIEFGGTIRQHGLGAFLSPSGAGITLNAWPETSQRNSEFMQLGFEAIEIVHPAIELEVYSGTVAFVARRFVFASADCDSIL